MSLQWTTVAGFMYAEIVFIILMMLPWIRPDLWRKFFHSRFFKKIERHSHIIRHTIFGILCLLFLDAIREVRKYSMVDLSAEAQIKVAPQSDTLVHMRLFRAQRNLYISGFALFLWLVIRRMISLLLREAALMLNADASLKQATNATQMADKYISEKGSKKGGDSEKDALAIEITRLRKELKIAESDRDAMREQSDGLKREYDRLMKDFERVQTTIEDAEINAEVAKMQ